MANDSASLADLDGLADHRPAPAVVSAVLVGGLAVATAGGALLTHYGGGLWQLLITFALWAGTGMLAWTYARREFRTLVVFFLTFTFPMTLNVQLIEVDWELLPAGAPKGYRIWEKDIFLFMLGIDWILDVISRRRSQSPRLGWVARWPVVWIIAAMMFPFHSVCPTRSFIMVIDLVRYTIAFCYLAKKVDRRIVLRAIVLGVMAQIWIESLVSLAQYATGSTLGLSFLGETLVRDTVLPSGAVIRTGALMGHPNRFALWLILVMPLPLALAMMRNTTMLHRVFYGATALMATTVLVLTFSRAGWACCIINFFLTYYLVQRRYGKPAVVSIAVPAFVALIAGAGLFFGVTAIRERLTESGETSTFGRIPQFFTALNIIREYPLTGTGIGSYAPNIPLHADFDGRYFLSLRYRVHNGSLLTTAETGLLGGLGLHGWFYCVFRKGWGIWRLKDDYLAIVGIATFVGVVSWFIKSMYNIHTPEHDQSIWMHAAMIYILYNVAAREERERASSLY